jgi:hypothetical protein
VNKFTETLGNTTFTENGMPTNKSTFNTCLDLFYRIGNRSNTATSGTTDILQLFKRAYADDPVLAIKIVGWSRSIRNGAGVREHIRAIIEKGYVDAEKINWSWFGQNGYWKDLFYFNPSKFSAVSNILLTVGEALNKQDNLILKYLPRRKKNKAHKYNAWVSLIKGLLDIDDRSYRKLCSSFVTPESLMCANKWEHIEYSKLPSICLHRNRKSFFTHDKTRFEKFVGDAKAKPESVKMNVNTLYPHEIIKPLVGDSMHNWIGRPSQTAIDFAEAQWKHLSDKFNTDKKILVVGDTSGSMDDGTSIYISLALTIYCAERITGAFHNFACTFSSQPSFIQFHDADSLMDKIKAIPEIVSDTNIEAVFNLMLNKAVREKIPSEDMPEVILIISDMQFNGTVKGLNALSTFRDKYERAGYNMPNIVFWNVRNSSGIPATDRDSGVILFSGASPNCVKQAIEGNINPLDAMLSVVDKEEYYFLES